MLTLLWSSKKRNNNNKKIEIMYNYYSTRIDLENNRSWNSAVHK